jgi:hypothetical protein
MKVNIEDLQSSCDTCPVPTEMREDLCRICANSADHTWELEAVECLAAAKQAHAFFLPDGECILLLGYKNSFPMTGSGRI